MTLTQEQLKEVLDYNPETGEFTWKVKRNGTKGIGQEAGTTNKRGYIIIGINKKSYYAHRLAFLYVNNHVPKEVDHINRNKSDNKINNLRIATRAQQMANRSKSYKTPLYKGIYFVKTKNKWRANCQNQHIGYFETPEEAAKAYDVKAKEVFGEFAKLNFES